MNEKQNQPVMAEAVPVNSVPQASAPPTVVYIEQQQAPHGVVQATYVTPQQTESANIGVCRRCRREFVRQPGVNDGQAQYYRCGQCEEYRLADMIAGSCVVC